MKKLSRANMPDNMLDKKAAKMVEEVRLQTIQREYKSSGALLDTRELHRLDDVNTNAGREKAQAKLDTQKRVDSRRGARTHKELTTDAKKTIDNMMAKGQAIVKTSNFENEELIWATKSSDPNYSKKRKYDDPELHEFRLNLDMEQKKVYKVLCHDALVNLATKLREEMNTAKADMDLAGIFHPDANAHRAHCMYLMKLYNHVRAETIEDPVLRKMKGDIESQEKAARDEERKQRMMIKSIERKNKKGGETEAERLSREADEREEEEAEEAARVAASTTESSKRRQRRPPLHMASSALLEEGKTRRARGLAAQRDLSLRKSSSAKILPGHGPPPLPGATLFSTMKSSSKDDSSLGRRNDDGVSGDGSVVSLTDSSLASSSVSGLGEGLGGKTEGGMTHADQKMFAKMKRGKMGKVDPKTLLLEEAKTLEKSEVHEQKQTRERSTLVDASMGSWIMGLLQTSQINKTSEGTTSAPPAPGLLPTSNLENPSIDSPAKTSHQPQGGGEYNPQTIVPFQEFYEMFKLYSDEHQRAAEKAAKKEEEELIEAQRRAQEEEEAAAEAEGEDKASEAGGEAADEAPEGARNTTANDSTSEEADASAQGNNSSRPSSRPSSAKLQQQPGQATGEAESKKSAAAAQLGATLPSEIDTNGEWAPTDVLAELEETDPNFQAYMKMLRRQNPQGKKLFRNKGSKRAKAKPANPLGQKAVTMTDSRGAATADSSKGFKNVFNEARADDDSSDDDEYYDDANTHSVASHDDSTLGPGANDEDGDDLGLQDGQTANTATIEALAKISTTSIKPDTPSKRSSRPNSRSRPNRQRASGGAAGDSSGGELTLQKKLTVTFDCLQTPALARLSFMRKYATAGRATQFQSAVDILSEAAVVVMARQHIVHRASMALKDGLAVLPLIADRLLSTFYEAVPAIFASRDRSLSSQVTSRGPIEDPASAKVYSSIVSIVHQLFPNDRVNDHHDNMMTPDSAKDLLAELEYTIDVMLHDVQAVALEQLNEQVEIAGGSIAAWQKKLKNIIDPPKKSDRPEEQKGSDEVKDAK